MYAVNINSDSQPIKIISKSFYGFDCDTEEGLIYGLYSPSVTTSGYLFRYKNTGELIDSFKTGIGPNNAVFY